MTATIRPTRCPHGADLMAYFVVPTYEDGCRTTTSGAPVRFWCGPDEMSKPNGVSITAGEYLAAWDEALAEDERLTAETHPDTPETREYLQSLADDSDRLVPDGFTASIFREHAEYLGEVPWSDRVDD